MFYKVINFEFSPSKSRMRRL